MWLNSITHTGKVGTALVAENAVTFGGIQQTNRVDTVRPDSIAALIRWRVRTITSETGSVITVGYMAPQCVGGTTMPSPDANTKRCFPQYWTPPGRHDPQLDWFQKYPVTQVLQSDPTGGSVDGRRPTTPTPTRPGTTTTTTASARPSTRPGRSGAATQHVTTTTGAPGDVRTETQVAVLPGHGRRQARRRRHQDRARSPTRRAPRSPTPSRWPGRPARRSPTTASAAPRSPARSTDKFVYQTASQTEAWGTSHRRHRRATPPRTPAPTWPPAACAPRRRPPPTTPATPRPRRRPACR